MTINLKNFLNPNIKISKMGDFQELKQIDGLSISAVSADLYDDTGSAGRDDLCLFYFKDGAKYAAIYTKSSIVSESIHWNLKAKNKSIKALMVNTRSANTFTGKQGFQGLKELSKSLSKNLTLKLAQTPEGVKNAIDPNEIIFASTGIIGDVFPTEKIKKQIPYLVQNLKDNQNKYVWFKAASSILTTDTRVKVAYAECKIGSKKIKISAIAKGSGMIFPSMATMLAFIFTDSSIPSPVLKALLLKNVNTTFNAISCDGDTSTNDSVFLFATGKVKHSKIYNILDPKLKGFEKALYMVMENLSKQIIVDGEGAKKFITINVTNARSTQTAKKIAFSVANSPLVKTAMGAGDPNYGRIIAAIGKSEENIVINNLTIKFGEFTIVENGQQIDNYKEELVKEYMKWDAIEINILLNMGSGNFTAYTCDFTKDYIDINTDYRN